MFVSGDATFKGETVFEGNEAAEHGGGLYVGGKGTFEGDVTFDDNKAGMIGGGALISGEATFKKDATFTDNTAVSSGGGLRVEGQVTIDGEALFEGNEAGGTGGGLSVREGGTVANATFKDNKAGMEGGAIFHNGMDGVDLTIKDSVFIRNEANTGGQHVDAGNAIHSMNTDLIVEGENVFFRNVDNGGEEGGIVASSVDKTKGSIVGPTFVENYKELEAAATAKKKVVVIKENISFGDQQGAIVFTDNVTILTDEDKALTIKREDDTKGGLLEMAAAGAGESTNKFSAENLTFTGADKTGDGGALKINGDARLTDCSFVGNTATRYGGAVYVEGDATFKGETAFVGNDSRAGGGLYSWGNTTFEGSAEFDGNTAGTHGGGALISGTGTFEKDATFTENHALNGDGGGLDVEWEAKFKGNATFTDNTATRLGGGGYFNADATFEGEAEFVRNKAVSGYGGGVYVYGNGEFQQEATFTNNIAGYEGGGAKLGSGSFEGTTTFTDNEAGLYGGGVYFVDGGTVSNATFEGNEAGELGGAIYNRSNNGGTLTIEDTAFTDNTANTKGNFSDTGGAIHTNSDLIVEGDNTFTGNEPEGNQGLGIQADDIILQNGGRIIDGTPQPDPEPYSVPVVSEPEPEPEPIVIEIVRPQYKGITYSGQWCRQLFLGGASRDFRIFGMVEDGEVVRKGEQRLFQTALSGDGNRKIQMSMTLGQGLDGQAMIETSVAVLERLDRLEIKTIALMNPVTEQADVYQTGELYELVKEIEGATHVWLTGTDGTVYTVDASGAATPVE